MDNEKYGIELELVLGKFKQKIQEVKSAFTGISDKKVTLNANTRQIENLRYQIEQISAKLRALKETPVTSPKFNYGEIVKTEAQLERITNQYNKLINQQGQLSKSTTTASVNITKGLDKMTTKIKRFGLSLLGIRSIWALVSRASSAYLAQDTEMANKLQAAWVGLGSILAPIINFIATLMLKLVSVVNMVVKALTGVDLIAKATAKSMKGAAGSAKSLNKALAGFDELNNLDSDMGAGAGAGGINWADAFATIDTDWATMMESFYNTVDTMSANVLNKIQTAKNKAIGIMQDMGWASGVINGYSLMMDGIGELWVGLTDVVKGVVEVIDGILTLDIDKIWKGLVDFFSGIGNAVMGVLDLVVGVIDMATSALWEGIKKAGSWIYNNLIQPIGKWFAEVWKLVKTITFNVWDSIKTKVSNTWNSIKDFVVRVGEKAGEIISGAFKGVVNGVLSAIEKILNTPIRAINKLINVINDVPGINLRTLSTFNLPRLNVGTNYVPEDQIAMIHKGEAVIPKKFNSKEYFGGSNDETNARLEELIDAVRNIEINPYTTIKDVGKSALNYINNKSRQLGESVVV